jgi:hypothetical protein
MTDEGMRDPELDFEERMYEFQRTINRLRDAFRKRRDE